MLDHKNQEIEDLKQTISSKEEEIEVLKERKNEYWDELELKMEETMKENESLKDELSNLDQIL